MMQSYGLKESVGTLLTSASRLVDSYANLILWKIEREKQREDSVRNAVDQILPYITLLFTKGKED